MSAIHSDIATANPDAFRVNDHEDELSGGGPMTSAQKAELLCLSQRAEEPDAYDENITHLEAENRIKLLKRKLDG
ncbi:DUF3072 domain-containing protein [Pelagibacterium lentulum]|uniref:DUF3072 domain-containing protein n=1 Tax=Pelagibacterium lentulum TaxID=2029865 RepID=A0A916RB75_9HYPH|nr:DUF3072 domain-containing protein [Pelagibacterium lentulum]GGA46876.1 hypothetical protein GCM10011499_15820 [Pelagibacterium lentulum]